MSVTFERSIAIGRRATAPCLESQALLPARCEPLLEFGYREELERYSNDAPWFKYVATVSRPWEDLDWKGRRGVWDDLLRKYGGRWGLRSEETTGYLCGHPTMVENCRGILQRAGWKKDAVFEEVIFRRARGERAGAG